ncbi:MAG: sodium-dependent transporter [Bacteroidales bacterium]|nr:sodium-dependent transporter [Bacteroidales bacterium]
MSSREQFTGRISVVLAMAGSAIGLGNIWRFPYLAGQNGGAAFIIVYIISCALLAVPVFLSECVIGRRSGRGTFGAMRMLAPGSNLRWAGMITVITPVFLLSYYSVVGGWSVDYLLKSLALRFTHDTTGIFESLLASPWEKVFMHTTFMVVTAIVILLGVKKGIERFTRATMPTLFVIIILIVVFGLTLPGAEKGVEYLVKPDFSKLTPSVIASAMGQAFFSMSLGVGTILTYASYVPKEENLMLSAGGTAIADLLFAILAGFAVMPAVFAAGIEPGQGPGLIFDTLPYIFSQMTPWVGAVVSILFFLSVLVAALTSSISLLEVGVAYLVEERGVSRTKATIGLGTLIWAIGVACTLSGGVFDFFDHLCSDWLMPFGGLLFAMFVGWKMSKADVRDELTNGGKRNRRLFDVTYFLIRYFAPIGILGVFLTNLLG